MPRILCPRTPVVPFIASKVRIESDVELMIIIGLAWQSWRRNDSSLLLHPRHHG